MCDRVIAANNPILFVDPWGLTTGGRMDRILPGYPGAWDYLYNWAKDKGLKGIVDDIFNNPATEVLDTIPPGTPVTGNELVDRLIGVYQAIGGVWNEYRERGEEKNPCSK